MSDDELKDAVWGELLVCYGEGENTDWPWFTDLVDVVIGLIGKYGASNDGSTP
jgi:hypothetical protein